MADDATDPTFDRLAAFVSSEIRQAEERLAKTVADATASVENRLLQSFVDASASVIRSVQAQFDEVLAYLRDHDTTHVEQSGRGRRERRELRPAGGDGLAARRDDNGDENDESNDEG